jgi:phage shock protein PspC (stress-responsive transcriptional regulator)
VCGGIADRFDVDVTLVRVAFVVVAFFWGLGVVVYLAMWALVPVERTPDGSDDAPGESDAQAELPTGPPWLTGLLLTGALFIGLIFSSTWWGGPGWGGGLGLLWLLILFAVVVAVLRRPRRSISPGRVLLAVALVVVSLVIVAAGAFLGAVSLTGVPLTGGIGQRVVQPTSTAQLQRTYRLAAGSMTIDLTHVPLGTVPRSVTASVGVGQLAIDVPPDAVVTVSAHAGIGTVVYGPGGPQSFPNPVGAAPSPFGPPRPQLVVDAQVGIGRVLLERGTP